MMVLKYMILFCIFLIGCASKPINIDTPLHKEEYKHYYVLREQTPDENLQEKIQTTPQKISGKLKKIFVKPKTNVTVKPNIVKTIPATTKETITPEKLTVVQLPTTVTNDLNINEPVYVPIDREQVVIIDAKNTTTSYLAILQAIIIVCLITFIHFKRKRKTKKTDTRVLKL